LKKPLSSDPAAYDLYLRGRYLLNKRTVESIQKARALFEQAVVKDPNFSLGHSGIADAYILLAEYGAITAEEGSRAAWPEAARAITLDDQLAEGYISRAMLLTDFGWNWPAAEKDFRTAIDLNPNSVTASHWYAFHLAQSGRFDEALRMIDKAVKLDPLSPIIYAAKARILWVAHRPEDAIIQCRKALELEGNFAPAFVILGRAYVLEEQYPLAIEAANRYLELSGGKWGRFELAYIAAAAKNQTESDKYLAEASPEAIQRSPCDRAAIPAVAGNYEEAAHWVEVAIAEGNLAVAWMQVDPRFDNIRKDPRFAKLLAQIKPRRQP
jgi:tetratricopeptide (TPR) repeat protein